MQHLGPTVDGVCHTVEDAIANGCTDGALVIIAAAVASVGGSVAEVARLDESSDLDAALEAIVRHQQRRRASQPCVLDSCQGQVDAFYGRFSAQDWAGCASACGSLALEVLKHVPDNEDLTQARQALQRTIAGRPRMATE